MLFSSKIQDDWFLIRRFDTLSLETEQITATHSLSYSRASSRKKTKWICIHTVNIWWFPWKIERNGLSVHLQQTNETKIFFGWRRSRVSLSAVQCSSSDFAYVVCVFFRCFFYSFHLHFNVNETVIFVVNPLLSMYLKHINSNSFLSFLRRNVRVRKYANKRKAMKKKYLYKCRFGAHEHRNPMNVYDTI